MSNQRPRHDEIYERVTLYLSPEQKQQLQDTATEAGLSMSSYARQVLVKAGAIQDVLEEHGALGKGRRDS